MSRQTTLSERCADAVRGTAVPRRALLIGDGLWRVELARSLAKAGISSTGAGTVADAAAWLDSAEVAFFDLAHLERAGDPLQAVSTLWWVAPGLPVIFCGDHPGADLADAARDAGIPVMNPAVPSSSQLSAVVDVVAGGLLSSLNDGPSALARAMAGLCELGGSGEALVGDAAVAIIAELFKADICSVMLVDDDGVLRTIANVGLEGVRGTVARAGGLGELVWQTGTARLIIGDARRTSSSIDACRPDVTASMLTPIRGPNEEVRGVLTVGKQRRCAVFTPRDLEVCSSVATLLGELLARADAAKEARALELRLQGSERLTLLGELAAGVVHDVASPLGAVRANLEVLIGHLAELLPLLESCEIKHNLTPVLEDLPALLCETYEGLFRANDVIRQMRQVVRLGRTGQGEAVDVAAAVESAVRMLRSRVTTPVSFIVEERGFIRGVAVELLQAITNLIANANDACVERRAVEPAYRPEILVTLKHSGEEVVVVVRDNGAGMSPEVLARMWEKLFTTKAIGKGTGLGMPIVQRVVSEHQGRIEVSSIQGTGTEFRLFFPREAAEADACEAAAPV